MPVVLDANSPALVATLANNIGQLATQRVRQRMSDDDLQQLNATNAQLNQQYVQHQQLMQHQQQIDQMAGGGGGGAPAGAGGGQAGGAGGYYSGQAPTQTGIDAAGHTTYYPAGSAAPQDELARGNAIGNANFQQQLNQKKAQPTVAALDDMLSKGDISQAQYDRWHMDAMSGRPLSGETTAEEDAREQRQMKLMNARSDRIDARTQSTQTHIDQREQQRGGATESKVYHARRSQLQTDAQQADQDVKDTQAAIKGMELKDVPGIVGPGKDKGTYQALQNALPNLKDQAKQKHKLLGDFEGKYADKLQQELEQKQPGITGGAPAAGAAAKPGKQLPESVARQILSRVADIPDPAAKRQAFETMAAGFGFDPSQPMLKGQ